MLWSFSGGLGYCWHLAVLGSWGEAAWGWGTFTPERSLNRGMSGFKHLKHLHAAWNSCSNIIQKANNIRKKSWFVADFSRIICVLARFVAFGTAKWRWLNATCMELLVPRLKVSRITPTKSGDHRGCMCVFRHIFLFWGGKVHEVSYGMMSYCKYIPQEHCYNVYHWRTRLPTFKNSKKSHEESHVSWAEIIPFGARFVW